MGNDEQIGFDIEFDDKTQAFLDWVATEHMESKISRFLTETIPDVADYSTDTWWKPPVLTRILEAAKELFGDPNGFIAPENRDRADQFVRFLGECCIRRNPGMTWTNKPEYGTLPPLYTDFGPAVHYADTGLTETPKSLVNWLFDDDGPKMVDYCIRTAGKPV
ncbi:hypothetical protein [Nocardia pseudovaccinii]|uniref:hypothetical protein n=1 Tax=Nocardia pseudovaccinii TaxID=189540 RepID=UPI000ACD29DF|nr:hypothetical protein [Nocardia pseudovaccinii]